MKGVFDDETHGFSVGSSGDPAARLWGSGPGRERIFRAPGGPNTEGESSVPLEEEPESEPPSRQDSIPFTEDQLYAAAYLGFEEMEDLSYYTQRYLDSGDLPIHYFSPGEYYLIIPRYPDMSLALYKNDIQTDQPTLVYEDPVCEPFLIQCNISDIFSDVTVELTYQGETVSFSPYISLKDGSVQVGERGLDLSRSGG